MAIVVVSRWKGPNDLTLSRQAGPLFKKHGAVSVRIGFCYSGQYTGQLIAAVAFPDWAAYGSGMQAAMADPDYQRSSRRLPKPSSCRIVRSSAEKKSDFSAATLYQHEEAFFVGARGQVPAS